MTDVKQELPDGWELTPLGHALRAAIIACEERDAAIKRAEEAATKLEKENESWRTVAALTDENEKLRESRDAAIKRAEEAEQNAELRSAQLSMVAGEITGDSKLHWLNDRGDPRWTPSLQEAWALRQKVKECAAQIVDALKEVSALRAENEQLRGELAEHEADAADFEKQFAKTEELRLAANREVNRLTREFATIAEKTAERQRARAADLCMFRGMLATARDIAEMPLVTDAPSKPKEPVCKHCGQTIDKHQGSGTNPRYCGPLTLSAWASNFDPAPPPPESPAETRLRPCDSPGCGGHHDDE